MGTAESKLCLSLFHENVIKLMKKLGYSVDEALDFYDTKGSNRPQIKELVAEMINAVPA